MSEDHQGDGWWMASDGNWYPSELHPSVRGDSTGQAPSAAPAGGAPAENRVGPQFPDLFQTALQGHHLADNVSVKYDGDDQRNVPDTTPSYAPRASAPSRPAVQKGGAVASGGVGEFSGAASKRRWRRH
jgi:hypothetical protein